MPLLLQKKNFSRLPWRIVLRRSTGDAVLPDSGGARKCDLMPDYQRLLAVGNWDAFDTWPLALHQEVQRILDTMPMRRELVLLRQRHHAPR